MDDNNKYFYVNKMILIIFYHALSRLNDPRLEILRWILITTENNNFGRMDPLAIANQVHEIFSKPEKIFITQNEN